MLPPYVGPPKCLKDCVYSVVFTAGGIDRIVIRGEAVFKEYLAARFVAFILKYPEHEILLKELLDNIVFNHGVK